MRDKVMTGMLGVGATGGTVAVSFAEHLEVWMRIASLGVGLAVGLLTIVSIVRKWNK